MNLKPIIFPVLLILLFVSCKKLSIIKLDKKQAADTSKHATDTTRHPVDTSKHPVDTTKHPVDTIKNNGARIYISGTINYANGTTTAVYWRNGKLIKLTKADVISSTSAIAVKDTNVYIAGSIITNGETMAVYWKNGVPVILGKGFASAIFIQGSDVYVAGSGKYGGAFFATYWKNGIAVELDNPAGPNNSSAPSTWAYGIFVKESDVYVAGGGNASYGGGNPIAVYWKNGSATRLTRYYEGSGGLNATSNAYDITVNGSDVYIAGQIAAATSIASQPGDISGAVYWKNGNGVALTDNILYTVAKKIALQGSDIYSTGVNNTNKAILWKNNVEDPISNLIANSTNATGIKIFNNDIYISGYTVNGDFATGRYPIYWKNGNVAYLTSPTSAETTGIAITK
jgi:hypothetical protein